MEEKISHSLLHPNSNRRKRSYREYEYELKSYLLRLSEYLKKSEYALRSKSEAYQLQILRSSGNQLTVIEKDIFAELKALRKLHLSRNPSTTLYPESFAGLKRLQYLYMDHCKLISFDFSYLSHMVQELNTSNNQIATIKAMKSFHFYGIILISPAFKR